MKPTSHEIPPGVSAAAEKPVFPVQVSENGRYFVDQNGRPVFWLGDTQWDLFRRFSLGEARTILQKRALQGFTMLQIMMIGVGDGSQVNLRGESPWIDNDPATPNEAYFRHVDAIV